MFWLSCVVSNVVLALFLALAAWLVQRGLRRPALAHALWVLTLVKLVTPPLVTVPLQETPLPPACQDGTCRCGLHGPAAGQATLAAVLGAVWLAGALATAGAAAWRWARFRRLAAHAVPAPAEWQALAARLAADLGLRRPPAVMAVPGRLPPLVMAGWRRPRLLVPAALMGRLTGPQQAALVLHELTHLRRGDHLVRLLEMAVGVAYWWLPGVRRIGRQLRACEEACCDAAVVAREPQARRAYARLLLDVLDFVAPLPPAAEGATAMHAAQDLERRLRAILGAPPATPARWPAAVVLGLACTVVPCGLGFDGPAPPAPAVGQIPAAGPPPAEPQNLSRLKLECCCPS